MIYLFEQYFRSPLIVKNLNNGHYIHINDDIFYKATAYNFRKNDFKMARF